MKVPDAVIPMIHDSALGQLSRAVRKREWVRVNGPVLLFVLEFTAVSQQ